jgi:rubredoxin
MQQTTLLHFNFTGGIISPGHLKEILELADAAKVSHVCFGLRQQLMMEVGAKYIADFEKACAGKELVFYQSQKEQQNIVSSYPATDIFTGESWLKEGAYKDVFDSFDHEPLLKINICDSNQHLVPLFTGHLNWISSPSQHFWYLYIRFPRTQKIYGWPELVYSNDIAQLSKQIEKSILNQKALYYNNERADGNSLFEETKNIIDYVGKKIDHEILLSEFSLPYYEGFNKIDNSFWLGIYSRDELFAVPFLIDICNLCMETKIGQLYTTTWKSLIIKGIEAKHRKMWDYILGKYRINVRHAANELNWQTEDNNEDGLIIKRHIIRHFDKEDVRTDGLIFAVKTKPSSSMFASVIINRQEVANSKRLKSKDRFDIYHTKDFNPNSSELILFREGVEKDHIGTYLISLCKIFYEQESHADAMHDHHNAQASQKHTADQQKYVYQCTHCYTVYDEQAGEPESNIKAGTKYEVLPVDYTCCLCGAVKEELTKVNENILSLKI